MPAPTFSPKTIRRTAAPAAPVRRAVKAAAHVQGASSGMPRFARTSQPVAATPTAKIAPAVSSPAATRPVSAAKKTPSTTVVPTTVPATPDIRSRFAPPAKSPLPRPLPLVTSPGDRWEREAHDFADFATRFNDRPKQLLSSTKLAPLVAPVTTLPIVSSSGAPLPTALSRKIEAATGHGVSSIRVHDNKEAQHAAQSLKAHAFTVGSNIYLGPTANPSDQRLLAHETAHTFQQTSEIRAFKPALKSAQSARGPPRSRIDETAAPRLDASVPQLTRAPHGAVQRLELDPLLPIATYAVSPLLGPVLLPTVQLGSRGLLTRSLQDTLDQMLSGGLSRTLSFVTDNSLEVLLSTFALKPGHFSWPLAWFRGSLPIIEYSSRAQDLLSNSPQDTFADSLRGLSQMLRAVFNGNWRWLAESFTATQLSYAQLRIKIGATLGDLGGYIGQAQLGRRLDSLADDLRANAAVLDGFPTLRADVAEILGFIDFNSPTATLVTWVENIRNAALYVPSHLKSIATGIETSLQLVEPLDLLRDLGKGTQTLRDLLDEAADAVEEPDNVADDGRLFKVVLPGITNQARWLGLAIGDAAIWPSTLSLSFLEGVQNWTTQLHDIGYGLHDWVEATAREIFLWISDVFDTSFATLEQIFTLYDNWTEPLEDLFSAMAPAMTDENTKEVKPPFLIRALRKLGVPEELLSQLQAHIKSLGKVLKHPFKFFRNLTSAIVKGLYNFAGNIGRHLFEGIAAWILGDLPIAMPKSFDLPSIFASLATLLGLTLDHVLDVLERKYPGVGRKVRRALAAGTLAIKWLRLIYEKKYAELWEELKAEISTFWSQIIEQVQQTVINILIEGGITLLMNFLTPGLRQAVSIIRKIYQIIKNLKAQATRMMGVVNAIFQSIDDIVEGKLDKAIEFVEKTAVKVLHVAIRFFADWLGLGDIPAKIRKAVDEVRSFIDKGIEKIIDFAKKVWEWLGETVASVLEWWKNKNVFRNEAGEIHTLYFDEKMNSSSPPLAVATTPKVLKDYIADYKKKNTTTVAEDKLIAKIETHAAEIDRIKAKTAGSFGQKDGEDIRAHFDEIAKLLASLGRPETVPPSNVKWLTLSGKYNDGHDMTADPLTLDPGGNEGSQPFESSKLWNAVNQRSMTYIRGHLLNHHVHGPGAIKNLIPITRSANGRMERIGETYVKEAVIGQKKVIHYRVWAKFHDPKPKRKYIPEEAELPKEIYMMAYYKNKKGNRWETDFSNPFVSEVVPNDLPADTKP
ncbi:MAG: DUF4157 domain-containing protein [Nibricoccus sp.]